MKVLSLVFVTAVAAAAGSVVAGETDFHNCTVCKPMMAEPGLMENVRWESHEIATGMLSVTTVSPGYEQAFERAHGKMMEAVARLEAGEKGELCPFCKSIDELSKAGAHIENLDAEKAHIMAITSDKADVIEKIHAHVRWAKEEFKKHQGSPEHKG